MPPLNLANKSLSLKNFAYQGYYLDNYEREVECYNHIRLPITLRHYRGRPGINYSIYKYWYNIDSKPYSRNISELNVLHEIDGKDLCESQKDRDPDSISDEEFNLYILKYSNI
jgi:hypothetical protein